MSHIFISYSHNDQEYADKLREALQNEGFEVWIDDRIDYGDEWPMIIQERLDACQAFILIASENSYKSKWVQKEVARAQRINKVFFPLLLSGQPWLTIESTQYVDVRNGFLPPERFYKRLAAISPRVRERTVIPEISTLPNPTISQQPDSRKLVKWAEFWNAKRKKVATRVGIGVGFFIIVATLLFALGSAVGFINTDNAVVAQSSTISNLITTTGSNNSSNTFSFSTDQPIYVRFNPNSRTQTVYEAKWYYVVELFGGRLNFLVTTITYSSAAGDSSVYFQLDYPAIPGLYRVDIYDHETLIGRRYFTAD